MSESARLEMQLRFLTEIDRLKRVERQNILCDRSRRENSAEHSWHLGVAALCLTEHAAAATLDRCRVIAMLLIHDIVEIDAGDAFLHEPDELATQARKEQAAAQRIFGLLPDDQRSELLALWQEFEAGESDEAQFARVLDRLQPVLLHEATDGVVWKQCGTTHAQIQTKMAMVRSAAPRLWQCIQKVIERARALGNLR